MISILVVDVAANMSSKKQNVISVIVAVPSAGPSRTLIVAT